MMEYLDRLDIKSSICIDHRPSKRSLGFALSLKVLMVMGSSCSINGVVTSTFRWEGGEIGDQCLISLARPAWYGTTERLSPAWDPDFDLVASATLSRRHHVAFYDRL